jgi:predicted nucleic acid-binding protein
MFLAAWTDSEPVAGILFDTSVYIRALRQGDPSILTVRRARRARDGSSYPLWFSVVVLSELLVGASEKKARQQLLETEREFIKLNRLLVPIQRDWNLAGQVLAQVGVKYGYEEVGRARLTNDALIAMSAARSGFTVLTKNATDFQRIAEFRPFRWEEV